MKAIELLKLNIEALLQARHQTKRDLAQWCRKSESWLSHALRQTSRGIPVKHLDRIADFFGIAAYQLFQPGISPLTERRSQDRRSGRDRRVGQAHRVMLSVARELRAHQKGPVSANAGSAAPHDEPADALAALVTEFEARAAAILAADADAPARRQAPADRRPGPALSPPVRPAGRSRAPKA